MQAEKRARQRAREKEKKVQDKEAQEAEHKAALEQEIAAAAAEAAQLAARCVGMEQLCNLLSALQGQRQGPVHYDARRATACLAASHSCFCLTGFVSVPLQAVCHT